MRLSKPQILKRIKRRESVRLCTLGGMIAKVKREFGDVIDRDTTVKIINKAVKDVQKLHLQCEAEDFRKVFHYLNN